MFVRVEIVAEKCNVDGMSINPEEVHILKILVFIKKLYIGKTEDTKIQLYRSTQSSQYSYLIDLGIYWLMVESLFIPYPLARFLSYMTGTTLNYLLSILWIFPNRTIANRYLEYAGFAGVGFIGAGANIVLMILLKEFLGLYHLHANLIGGITVFFFLFIIRKILLFRKSDKD